MDHQRILVDTSIIIEFLRKKEKDRSYLWKIRETTVCSMSSLTLFELLSGAKTERHFEDIRRLTRWIESMYFDDDIAETAASIFRNLKQRNEMIEYRDIFIAATAQLHDLAIATLNRDHFERIEGLLILDLNTL